MCDVIGIINNIFDYIPTDLNNAFTEAVKLEFGENPRVWISW